MEKIQARKDIPNSFMTGPSQNQQPIATNTDAQKGQKVDANLNKMTDDLGQTLRILRMLEERYSTLRKKMQMSDQNIIDDTNKIFTQLKLIVKDISDLKIKIEDMRIKLDMFQNEIKEMATRQDLTVLQRYIELWEPMQFMTEKQAINLIRDALKEKETSKK